MSPPPTGPTKLPRASAGEAVRYVIIDDEPRYCGGLGEPAGTHLKRVGGYGSVEAFVGLQSEPCHVVVLDLCLNRQTGDAAVQQGVRAIRQLVEEYDQRVLVYTAEERPEPVARCVAAGAAGYLSKFNGDATVLAQAVEEIGRHGFIVTESLHDALRQLTRQCRDIRLSRTLENTLVLLETGLSDAKVADALHISVRTVEDHKRKILALFGTGLEVPWEGFGHLRHELGLGPSDLVNDEPGSRPARGLLRTAMPWLPRRRANNHD